MTVGLTEYQGKPAAIGTVKDITERKSMEDALYESEGRFRMMFENMSNAVAVYKVIDEGRNFIFKDFNQSAEKLEDMKREDLIGKNLLYVFPGVVDFGLFDVFKRVWQTGNPEHHPIPLYKDEGIVGWRENYVYKLPSGEIVAIYEDVTKRRTVECGDCAEDGILGA
jgi:PAS domain-containing protein